MKQVTKEDVLNNFSLWRIAVLLCTLKKPMTSSKISSFLKVSKSNPYFYKLIHFLEKEKFLEIDKSRNPYLFTINSKSLSWFLRQGEVFEICDTLLKISLSGKLHYYG